MRTAGAPTPVNDPEASRSLFDRGPALNPVQDAVCGEIANFLIREAELLDEDYHAEWLDLLAEDLVYRMPARNTLYRKDGRGYDRTNGLFDDNKASMRVRVTRSTGVEAAFDRDPPPRFRRMISNIAIHATPDPDEYFVVSSILVLRSRFDDPTLHMFPARREDLLRRMGQSWKLAKRMILPDQANLASIFLNVFM